MISLILIINSIFCKYEKFIERFAIFSTKKLIFIDFSQITIIDSTVNSADLTIIANLLIRLLFFFAKRGLQIQ